MALVELLMEAGAPPGVVNVIHGQVLQSSFNMNRRKYIFT